MLDKVNSPYLSPNKAERFVQISFISNACVDIMVDYYKGNIDMPFDELKRVIMSIIDKLM